MNGFNWKIKQLNIRIFLIVILLALSASIARAEEFSVLGFTLEDSLKDIIKKGKDSYVFLTSAEDAAKLNAVYGPVFGTAQIQSVNVSSSEWSKFAFSNKDVEKQIVNIRNFEQFTSQPSLDFLAVALLDSKNAKNKEITFLFTRELEVGVIDKDNAPKLLINPMGYENSKLVCIQVRGDITKFAKDVFIEKFGEQNLQILRRGYPVASENWWFEAGKLVRIKSFEGAQAEKNWITMWNFNAYENWGNKYVAVFNEYFEATQKLRQAREKTLRNEL
jgi:hypothetical protein